MWLRIDDNLPDHPKFATLDPLATALWLYGLCYAGRYLTNGGIPKPIAVQLASRITAQQSLLGESALIQKLVSRKLWTATESGYRIHNYLRYNPSRRKVLSERRTARLRRQRARRNRFSADGASGEHRATSQATSRKSSPVNDPTRPVPSLSTEKEIKSFSGHLNDGQLKIRELTRTVGQSLSMPGVTPGQVAAEVHRVYGRELDRDELA